MRVLLAAIGRLKTGPERDLCDRYMERAAASGRSLSLTDFVLREAPESRATRPADRRAEEARVLLGLLAPGARLAALDETGRSVSSVELARDLAAARDAAIPQYALAIGGPDGLDPSVRERADLVIAFGAMTWPHQLVRIMAAEQLYRATTILSGHPYHRA